jgi:hypothetical protein
MKRPQWKQSEHRRTDLMDEELTMGYRSPRKKQTKDFVVRGAPEERTFEKRQWTQLKFNNGIRHRGLKLQLRLSERALNKTVRQTVGLEVAKQVVGIFHWAMGSE